MAVKLTPSGRGVHYVETVYWCRFALWLLFVVAPILGSDFDTPPRVLHKEEPKYSSLALAHHIQGTVVLGLFVDTNGRPAEVSVISPLGFGLDEQAIKSAQKWKFAPGLKDGKPVKVRATVEVNFHFPDYAFNEPAERRRTSFNIALQTLKSKDATPAQIEKAKGSMNDLAVQGYPPALYVVGMWKINGTNTENDQSGGFAMLEDAAEKSYGPALYEIGTRRIDGRGLKADVDRGLDELRQAATLGSSDAQYVLGMRYEMGNAVTKEIDRARGYFRLCAVQGVAMCQYKFGSLLLNEAGRSEDDYVQAMAFLQLAADQGMRAAREMADKEAANLTSGQAKSIAALKGRLTQRQ
jgi:TonB family protein